MGFRAKLGLQVMPEKRDAVNPYPIMHQLHRGIFLLRFVNYKPGTTKVIAEFSRRFTKMLP
jgi:hypothetical protein